MTKDCSAAYLAIMSILTQKCDITAMECGRLIGRLEYLASQIALTEAREKAKAHSCNIVMTKCENR